VGWVSWRRLLPSGFVVSERAFDGFFAVGGLGDNVEVWFGGEEQRETFADEFVVVGDEHAGDGGDRRLSLCLGWNLEPDLDAGGAATFDRDGAADDQRALADASRTRGLVSFQNRQRSALAVGPEHVGSADGRLVAER
jgi:hypothetical protein